MATTRQTKSNSRSLKYDQGGRPYRDGEGGKKVYLSWEESYKIEKGRSRRIREELHQAGISIALRDQQLGWKQDEIDKLKQELEFYRIAHLQEEDGLRDAVAQIGRVLHNQDRYTKKQMFERMTDIMLKLSPNGQDMK